MAINEEDPPHIFLSNLNELTPHKKKETKNVIEPKMGFEQWL